MKPSKKFLFLGIFSIIFLSNFPLKGQNHSSQFRLEGEYYFDDHKDVLNDFSTIYHFNTDGTFTSQNRGDVGPGSYGKGTYRLQNKKLTLVYSDKKDPVRSKISIVDETNFNSSDSVRFSFEIYDLIDGKSIPAIISLRSKVLQSFQTEMDGTYDLLQKRGTKSQKYLILFIGYEFVEIDLKNNSSKSVKVGLAESIGIQILDKKIKYKIEKITGDTLHLNGEDFLIKVKSSE